MGRATTVCWVPQRVVKGVSYDTPIQGYGVNTCDTLTLWSARAIESLALEAFNAGDYYRAVDDEIVSKTITKVLSSSPVHCRTCCTSWKTLRACPCERSRNTLPCSSMTPIRRSPSLN